MIDARDHMGTPVITTCPTYVRHDGKLYEVDPEATIMRSGGFGSGIRFEDARWDSVPVSFFVPVWTPPSGLFTGFES